MTNHWIDLRNSDVFMICGANPSENHPCSWKWIENARENRGAKVIVVDPRFTRSAARADMFSFLRPGTDIAFFGALVNYAITKNLINWEYVQNYTNAPILVNPEFKLPGELDGLFSGYDASKRKYDKSTWTYQADAAGEPVRIQLIPVADNPDFPNRGVPTGGKDSNEHYLPNEWDLIKAGKYDEMQPSIYAKLAQHYSRYTYKGEDSIISKVVGMDPAKFEEIAELYLGTTSQQDKSGCLMYAMGLTQHTIGTENIRTFALLQLLMGNMGMAGGGINALRGESNVQGSTDMALLSHIIPAYISVPNNTDTDYATFLERVTPKAGWWVHTPKYMASLLVSFWGDYANKSLEAAYDLMPKVKKGKNYTHISLFEDMYKGDIIKGLVTWGQNVPVGGPNANLECAAMDKLDWYVAVDIWDTETMNFWQRPGAEPKDVNTEVWALPAASMVEKSGSVTHSGRVAQFRWKAIEPPGDKKSGARSDAFIAYQFMNALKKLYQSEGGPAKEALTELFCDYDVDEHGEPDMNQVLVEMNGFKWPSDGFSWDKAFEGAVANFKGLKDDGSTACGNWLYSGEWASDSDIATAAGIMGISGVPDKIPRGNQATEWNGIPFDKAKWHMVKTPLYWLDSSGKIYQENPPASAEEINLGTYPYWGWAWPVNRRIIYNRGSMGYAGQPFAPDKALFMFDESGEKLIMKNDVNDFYAIYKKGTLAADSGAGPFIMNKEVGVQAGRIFSNSMAEGPFPEHYEPRESPVHNILSGEQNNPAIVLDWPSAEEQPDKYGFADVGSEKYPYICSTYRVTEHWQAGQMTRNNSWLGEAMPELFVEISKELAGELGIKKGDLVEVESVRGKVQGVAVVTVRLKPFEISDNGKKKTVHFIGMPWHYGFIALFPGGPERDGISKRNYSANQITGHIGDANTTIPEYKAFLVNLRKVK